MAFVFGQPFDFWLKLGGRLHISETVPGDAKLAVSLTEWSGIKDISAAGNPMTDATVTSASTTNWTHAVTNSLPPTTNQTQIAQFMLTPNSIILSGTGGAAHGPFRIFSSTSLSEAPGTWPSIYNNRFGASGEFNTTNSLAPTDAQRFFRVQ